MIWKVSYPKFWLDLWNYILGYKKKWELALQLALLILYEKSTNLASQKSSGIEVKLCWRWQIICREVCRTFNQSWRQLTTVTKHLIQFTKYWWHHVFVKFELKSGEKPYQSHWTHEIRLPDHTFKNLRNPSTYDHRWIFLAQLRVCEGTVGY